MRRSLATLVLACLGSVAAVAADTGCAIDLLRVSAAGVATYAAECHWPVAPRFVAEIVGDPARMAAASSSLAVSTRLGGGRVLNVISPGWPLGDRQSTLQIDERALPKGGLRLAYSLAAVQEPLVAGRVQVRQDDGRWEILGEAGGGVRVRYETTFDAGGSLPASVVRRSVPQHMTRSLREVRAAAEARAREARARDGRD